MIWAAVSRSRAAARGADADRCPNRQEGKGPDRNRQARVGGARCRVKARHQSRRRGSESVICLNKSTSHARAMQSLTPIHAYRLFQGPCPSLILSISARNPASSQRAYTAIQKQTASRPIHCPLLRHLRDLLLQHGQCRPQSLLVLELISRHRRTNARQLLRLRKETRELGQRNRLAGNL